MALPPNANADVFMREVDEEVRRDQLTQFWTRWGKIAIAAIVLGLAVLGGVLYWQHRRQEAAGVEGEKLQAAFDALGQGRMDQAMDPLATLGKSDIAIYLALATFTDADIILQRNDLKAAAAKFAEVANDTGQAQPIRDLALIRQTAAEFDTLRPQVVIERMRPLAVPGGAWLGSAGEMMAVSQLRLGQRAPAGQSFARIARDEGVPASIRQRAVQMAGLLGVDAVPATPTAKQPAPQEASPR